MLSSALLALAVLMGLFQPLAGVAPTSPLTPGSPPPGTGIVQQSDIVAIHG